jgi:hypothetical protein
MKLVAVPTNGRTIVDFALTERFEVVLRLQGEFSFRTDHPVGVGLVRVGTGAISSQALVNKDNTIRIKVVEGQYEVYLFSRQAVIALGLLSLKREQAELILTIPANATFMSLNEFKKMLLVRTPVEVPTIPVPETAPAPVPTTAPTQQPAAPATPQSPAAK